MALTKNVSGGENGVINISFFGTPTASDNEIVAAVTGKSMRVYAFGLFGAGVDNAVYWKTGSTTHFGGSSARMTLNAAGPAGGVVMSHNRDGWFTGLVSESIALTASTTEAIWGQLTYKPLG